MALGIIMSYKSFFGAIYRNPWEIPRLIGCF